jgi:hypothetical protein
MELQSYHKIYWQTGRYTVAVKKNYISEEPMENCLGHTQNSKLVPLQTRKEHGGVQGQLQSFLTSALNGS